MVVVVNKELGDRNQRDACFDVDSISRWSHAHVRDK